MVDLELIKTIIIASSPEEWSHNSYRGVLHSIRFKLDDHEISIMLANRFSGIKMDTGKFLDKDSYSLFYDHDKLEVEEEFLKSEYERIYGRLMEIEDKEHKDYIKRRDESFIQSALQYLRRKT